MKVDDKAHKKHLKNVGPIHYCEPPHAHSPGVASGTVARRLLIDVHDANDNDNPWQRGPLWPNGMGPIMWGGLGLCRVSKLSVWPVTGTFCRSITKIFTRVGDTAFSQNTSEFLAVFQLLVQWGRLSRAHPKKLCRRIETLSSKVLLKPRGPMGRCWSSFL